MNDFFNRFPNLPFANMKSLEHIKNQGSMPERDSLLSDEPQPFKRQIQRSDRLLFKSKVLSAPKSDIQTTVLGTKENILTTSKYTADYKSTTQKPIPRSTRKRISTQSLQLNLSVLLLRNLMLETHIISILL